MWSSPAIATENEQWVSAADDRTKITGLSGRQLYVVKLEPDQAKKRVTDLS